MIQNCIILETNETIMLRNFHTALFRRSTTTDVIYIIFDGTFVLMKMNADFKFDDIEMCLMEI